MNLIICNLVLGAARCGDFSCFFAGLLYWIARKCGVYIFAFNQCTICLPVTVISMQLYLMLCGRLPYPHNEFSTTVHNPPKNLFPAKS